MRPRQILAAGADALEFEHVRGVQAYPARDLAASRRWSCALHVSTADAGLLRTLLDG